jgi:membrane-associated phospholipid phosphatase
VDSSQLIRLLTDAGDSGFLLPMALVGVAMLWLFHSGKLAWLLLRSVLLAGVLIATLKVFFLSCGAHWIPGLLSPSGHACLSAVVYGTMGTVLAAGRPRWARWTIGATAGAFVILIALSRIALGVHTLLEVLIGLAVGGLAQWWFARSYARLAPLRVDGRTFGLAVLVTVLVAFGVRLPVESGIRHFARRVAFSCAAAAAPAAATRARAYAGPSSPAAAPAKPACQSTKAYSRAVSRRCS